MTDSISMIQRYKSAAQKLEPKVAAVTANLGIDGYWLDDNKFFFVSEMFDKKTLRVLRTPSIFDSSLKQIAPLLALDELLTILHGSIGGPAMAEFASAQFDMPDGNTLVVRLNDRQHVVDLKSRRLRSSSASWAQPALYSPDGKCACFVRAHDLWLKDRLTGAERPLTFDGSKHYAYGQAPDGAQAAVPFRKPSAPTGLWSPDSEWFLTHRIDERALSDLPLTQHLPERGDRPICHHYKYSLPGDPRAIETYVALHIPTGRVLHLDDFPGTSWATSPFRLKKAWFGSANCAWIVRLDRYCSRAELIKFDLTTGQGSVVLSESVDKGYIDLSAFVLSAPNVRTLEASREIIWYSECDGWGHLYLHDMDSGLRKNRITTGAFQVRNILHIDEIERTIYLSSGGIDPSADPAQRSLCRVNFDGSGFEVIRSAPGDVAIAATEPVGLGQDRPCRPSYAQPGFSRTGRYVCLRTLSLSGNKTEIYDLVSQSSFCIAKLEPAADETLGQPFTALAADGATLLHGVMFLPSAFDAERKYPLIAYIYPGPQDSPLPQSFRSFSGAPAAALAEIGFATIIIATRGMPYGSRSFHQAGFGDLLEPQLSDHVAVISQLLERHAFLDKDKIGMFGASGGGAATARALFDYGDLFKVGVSVCGNHDASRYSASWSEKYRGPGNSSSWPSQRNEAVANKLHGRLMLVSGEMDQNVHLSHMMSLANALIASNRNFDMLVVPNAGHDVASNPYVVRRTWDYFVEHLLDEQPPVDFAIHFEPHEIERYHDVAPRAAAQ
jgi:dipeptidyl aminopeptidase/acylaminoacyl peptidase